MAYKPIEQGDKVRYVPPGSSVADAREGIAQKDGKEFRLLDGRHQTTTVRDKVTGEDIKDVTAFHKK